MPEALPKKYAIELRDKNFVLKQRIEHLVANLSWEWNRQGGCGRCTFDIPGDYLRFSVESDDDVRIYLPDAGGLTASLWYRGYVETASPVLSGSSSGSIKIECMGYAGWFDRILVHDGGVTKVYSSSEISLTVTDIINNYIIPNSNITLGTVDESEFTADTLEFKVSARDALRTCFELVNDVEYGVDENLAFFWRNRVDTISHKYFVGDHISSFQEKIDFKSIVNQIYLEGGETDGEVLLAQGRASDSISKFGKREDIVSNGSIVTNSVAQQYISSLLSQKSRPQRQLSISLKNISTRIELSLPIGAVSVLDKDATQAAGIWGTTANNGSNKIWGRALAGGSEQLYGGSRHDQVERITYTLSPEDGKIHADLTLGTSIGFSRASAEMKRIELNLSATRQRQL